jgi:NADH dehydrogenase FAD-containing subunit
MAKRVVIAGLGDTGVLVAIYLGRGFDVVGISTKPCLVSGQELGTRLTRPEVWKQDYLMGFGRYERLDDVRVVHGRILRIDAKAKSLTVERPSGETQLEPYDALVISSGVTNGFWRNDAVQDLAAIGDGIESAAAQIANASRIAVIGGGATGVSVSANVKAQYPEKDVHFFFTEPRPLPGYHPKVRSRIEVQLKDAGVRLHPGHRAEIPDGFSCDRFTTDPVRWSTGQRPFEADLVLWSVGRVRPNSSFVPGDMLDERGFVKTDEFLRVPGYDDVFAVGDVAASDPNRSSARNWGYRIVAHNVRATLEGKPKRMKRYEAPPYRWGSILGVQQDGLRVFQPNGGSFRFPLWAVRKLLFPIAVGKIIYKGIRGSAAADAESSLQRRRSDPAL